MRKEVKENDRHHENINDTVPENIKNIVAAVLAAEAVNAFQLNTTENHQKDILEIR